MTSVFIEASALFRAYTREPGSDVMDDIFSTMESRRIKGLISQFSVPEIIRGIIKRKNIKELDNNETQKIIDSILLDINTRVLNDELQILALKEEYLSEVSQLIRSSNFFVSMQFSWSPHITLLRHSSFMRIITSKAGKQEKRLL